MSLKSLLSGLSLGLAAVVAWAGGVLEIEHPWVRESPPNASMMAGYLTLVNETDRPLVLVGASSPQFERVEFHRSRVEGGMARMTRERELVVAPGKALRLAPGGRHLMLVKPKRALRAGDRVELTLRDAEGRSWQVVLPVRRQAPGMGAGHDDHGHAH